MHPTSSSPTSRRDPLTRRTAGVLIRLVTGSSWVDIEAILASRGPMQSEELWRPGRSCGRRHRRGNTASGRCRAGLVRRVRRRHPRRLARDRRPRRTHSRRCSPRRRNRRARRTRASRRRQVMTERCGSGSVTIATITNRSAVVGGELTYDGRIVCAASRSTLSSAASAPHFDSSQSHPRADAARSPARDVLDLRAKPAERRDGQRGTNLLSLPLTCRGSWATVATVTWGSGRPTEPSACEMFLSIAETSTTPSAVMAMAAP